MSQVPVLVGSKANGAQAIHELVATAAWSWRWATCIASSALAKTAEKLAATSLRRAAGWSWLAANWSWLTANGCWSWCAAYWCRCWSWLAANWCWCWFAANGSWFAACWCWFAASICTVSATSEQTSFAGWCKNSAQERYKS